MKYSFIRRVDAELMKATAQAWQQQIEADPENTAQPYYEACLPYCDRIVQGSIPTGDGEVCVAAVKADDDSHASALLVLAHPATKRDGRPLRMLNLYIQPSLNLADREPNIAALAWIAANAVVGALELTYQDMPAGSLKIHTAFPLDHEFMTAITTVLFSNEKLSDSYSVTSHGVWLIVNKK